MKPLSISVLLVVACASGLLSTGLGAPDGAAKAEDGKIASIRFKYEVLETNAAKPLKAIEDRYEQDLIELRKKIVAAGNLDYVLTIKKEIEEFRKGGGGGKGPDSFNQMRAAYLKERGPVKAVFDSEFEKLYEAQREELLAYGRTAHDAGKDDVVEQVKTELTALKERFLASSDGGAAAAPAVAPADPSEGDADSQFAGWTGRGRFHCVVDDRASIYVNGKLVHRSLLGRSVGRPCWVTVGDHLTIALTNFQGPKQFKGAFGSEDGKVVMSLRAADFVEVGTALDKRREFTTDELAAGDSAAVTVREKVWGRDQPLEIANQSEWIWGGEEDKSLLLCIIKPSMFTRQNDSKNAPPRSLP